MSKCPYCGNTSGKRDSRGGCISCGGMLEISRVAEIDSTHPYVGISASLYYKDEFEVPDTSLVARGILSFDEWRGLYWRVG